MANDTSPETRGSGIKRSYAISHLRAAATILRDNGRPEASTEVLAIADRLDAEDVRTSAPVE